MENFLELARTRRSIRKFEDKEIPLEDIQYFINAAVNAPSGCNSQCWRFVTIKDKAVINKLDEAIYQKFEGIIKDSGIEADENYMRSKRRMLGFFAKAPVVVAVFMTRMDFYDPTFMSALHVQGYTDKEIMERLSSPDLLSIGAAIQNMLLAIHEKGYGACWMNEPAIAGEEISKILDIPSEHKFISLIPIGIPAYTPKGKKMKEMEEVYSEI